LNDLDGIPASANPFTLRTVLRGEWGFDGPVVADYKAVGQLIPHGLAADGAEAARLAFTAGVDVEEESHLFGAHLPGLIARGEVPFGRLDEATRRVLRLKGCLGLFGHPFADEAAEAGAMLRPEARGAAREAAGLSLVLLKNEGDLLPLRPTVRSIAVLGPMADDRMSCLGPWHAAGRPEDAVTLLEGVRAEAALHEVPVRIAYARGCAAEGDDGRGIEEAARLARGADVAIVVVGEPWTMSGEATSRSSLELPGRQLDLIRAVHATGTPTVVVLMNGRPLTIGWVAGNVPSILEAWYPGVEAGHAIADALFGRVNPGGKLPVTFPRVVGQVPMYYNHMATGRPASPKDKYTSKYIDQPLGPLWPFGHGLSYTRFRLSGLALDAKEIAPDGRIGLSVDVKNVGDRAGDEVVQVYVRDVAASVVRPVRELRAFRRVTLTPGEARTLRFSLGPEDLGLYDRRMRYVVEPGEFRVYIGTSSVGGEEACFKVVAR
jgi:beta-glucosidase